jgi:type I restriction enzyme S subunit
MEKEREIPNTWETVKLDDLIIKMTNGANVTQFDEKVGLPISRIETIWNETIDLSRVKFVKEDNEDFIEKYKIRNNDILFSHINSDTHLGKTAIFKVEKTTTLIHGINLLLLRPSSEISADLINYQFKYLRIKGSFAAVAQKAVNQSSINQAKLKNFDFVLPPPPEQHRIVAKIEELFSSLDKGVEILKTARQQLKVYRQAVLKWAFEGNWNIEKFGNVAEIKRGKSKHRPRDAKELFGGPYPFIQTGEVRSANGGTIKKYSQTYSEIGLAQSKLWPKGTLCLTIAANIAETAFLGFDSCFPDSVVGIKTDENALSIKFINFYIQKLKQEIDSQASATAQKNINVEFLENIPIPIPQIKEQRAIVSEIESRLSVCDKIEESIEQSLKQAESLRQSILKKAFEGKLVPQDSADEPASAILARIKADRDIGRIPSPLRGGVRVKSHGKEVMIRAKGLRKNRPGG